MTSEIIAVAGFILAATILAGFGWLGLWMECKDRERANMRIDVWE